MVYANGTFCPFLFPFIVCLYHNHKILPPALTKSHDLFHKALDSKYPSPQDTFYGSFHEIKIFNGFRERWPPLKFSILYIFVIFHCLVKDYEFSSAKASLNIYTFNSLIYNTISNENIKSQYLTINFVLINFFITCFSKTSMLLLFFKRRRLYHQLFYDSPTSF